VIEPDPRAALERLAGSTAPLILGVRHHSPAIASIVTRVLEAFAPTAVLIELPADLGHWLPWLGHAGATSPLALAATVDRDPRTLAFYPFADFSPELVAIRWATKHGVRVEAFDLPVGQRGDDDRQARDEGGPTLLDSLAARHGGADFEELWDRLIEARAEGQAPEALRRAALLLGWTLRVDAARASGPSPHGLRREAHMRARTRLALAEPGARVAAVVGAFHASALIDPPLLGDVPELAPAGPARPVTTALLPYSFPLLDSRSGYPAGIRDPAWQDRVVRALEGGRSLESDAVEVTTLVTHAVRASRHVASFPDAREATRVALDLSRLRGLPAPSRREVLEGIESAMGQGEPIGRGRVLARALSKVMVGDRRGALADGTPRSGLGPYVETLFAELSLPGPRDLDEKELSLDPLRSPLDRRREVTLERAAAAGVSYASRVAAGPTAAAIETLSSRWTARFTPATTATIEVAGLFGITLADAARGRLLETRARSVDAGTRVATVELATLSGAARAGLGDLVVETLSRLVETGLGDATFTEIVRTHAVLARVRAGHYAALPVEPLAAVPEAPVFDVDLSRMDAPLGEALVRALDGLAGSDAVEDALSLRDLLDVPAHAGLGDARLAHTIAELARSGSPLMQGAATALAFFLGRVAPDELGARIESFLDVAGPDASMRLRGLMVVGLPALEAEPAFVDGIVRGVARPSDAEFLSRLPALRDGFDVLSPGGRDRLLVALVSVVSPEDGGPSAVTLETDPVRLAAFAEADRAAFAALQTLGLRLDASSALPLGDASMAPEGRANGAISTRDRLRLMLGRERDELPASARRAAIALDRLYGRGEGEGSNASLGAGTEGAAPSIRVWSDEIAALFGERVREEVLGRAAARGDTGAALALDTDGVRPSMELLEQILSLRGGLAEGDVARLRPLVSRIVAALVDELATRVRPSLAGLVSPRTTRRSGGPVDLRRTIQANLKTVRTAHGVPTIVPERMLFRARAKRSLDWHVVLVVDVSGSMEPSVIYSALMAAILSGMPALTVQFLAFKDRVVDLTEHAGDPLALLLEVAIGGGTLIGNALRFARSLVRVPSRTICLVVSDFEDGGPAGLLLSEVRALVEGGVHLLGLAALDDHGAPRYEQGIASTLAGAGMPVAALSPVELARWIGEKIR
jgi:hypothetical protein